MKEYRAYMFDFGHQWTIFKDKQDPEDKGDCICSEGHPAVTLKKEPVIDDVQMTFRPAGRVVDRTYARVMKEQTTEVQSTRRNESLRGFLRKS